MLKSNKSIKTLDHTTQSCGKDGLLILEEMKLNILSHIWFEQEWLFRINGQERLSFLKSNIVLDSFSLAAM